MKRVLFLMFGTIIAMHCGAQELNGKFEGLKNEKLEIRLLNAADNNYEKTEVIEAPGGKFSYKVPGLKGYRRVFIYNVPDEGERPTSIQTFIAEGQTGTLSGDFKNGVKVSGTSLYAADDKADGLMKPFNDKMDKISSDYQESVAKEGADKNALQEAAQKNFDAVEKEMKQFVTNYVKSNPADEACLFLAPNAEDPIVAYNQLAPALRNGVMKDYIDNRIKTITAAREREAKRLEAEKKLQPGLPAPEIVLNDLNNKPLSLSSLKGKYVILDWWGGWCIWCIRGVPKMKEYYAKYSDKMEILGIDCNETEEKWRAAVKEHELPWLHVYNPKNSGLTDTYAIQGYPTKMIINPDGTINKIIVGEDPTFYDYLDSLFK